MRKDALARASLSLSKKAFESVSPKDAVSLSLSRSQRRGLVSPGCLAVAETGLVWPGAALAKLERGRGGAVL